MGLKIGKVLRLDISSVVRYTKIFLGKIKIRLTSDNYIRITSDGYIRIRRK